MEVPALSWEENLSFSHRCISSAEKNRFPQQLDVLLLQQERL